MCSLSLTNKPWPTSLMANPCLSWRQRETSSAGSLRICAGSASFSYCGKTRYDLQTPHSVARIATLGSMDQASGRTTSKPGGTELSSGEPESCLFLQVMQDNASGVKCKCCTVVYCGDAAGIGSSVCDPSILSRMGSSVCDPSIRSVCDPLQAALCVRSPISPLMSCRWQRLGKTTNLFQSDA